MEIAECNIEIFSMFEHLRETSERKPVLGPFQEETNPPTGQMTLFEAQDPNQ